MDFDDSFRSATRHQTIRTVIWCATILVCAYWIALIVIAALKH